MTLPQEALRESKPTDRGRGFLGEFAPKRQGVHNGIIQS